MQYGSRLKLCRRGHFRKKLTTTGILARVARIDVGEKVLGTGKYPDDFYLDGMLYGSALRSKYPRARVLSIDKTKALALPGVEAVVTAKIFQERIKSGI